MNRFPNLSRWAVTHRQMVLFLLIGVLASGIFAFLQLGRLEDPMFNVPTMNAVVAWPGATAQQVQDQVLKPHGAPAAERRGHRPRAQLSRVRAMAA